MFTSYFVPRTSYFKSQSGRLARLASRRGTCDPLKSINDLENKKSPPTLFELRRAETIQLDQFSSDGARINVGPSPTMHAGNNLGFEEIKKPAFAKASAGGVGKTGFPA